MSMFADPIKNTRFFLTLAALGCLVVAMMADLIIIVMQVTVNETLFALLNVIVGALIAMANVAFNSYFKDRAQYDAIAAASFKTPETP